MKVRSPDLKALNGLADLSAPPARSTIEGIANILDVAPATLMACAITPTFSTQRAYHTFDIPKRNGGTRRISAPNKKLLAIQRQILRTILAEAPMHDAAHGFRAARSIASHARPHVGAPLVITADIADFFPSMHDLRVRQTFQELGYTGPAAHLLALLCTEPTLVEDVHKHQKGWRYHGQRRLPQGGPTSPALTNIMCRNLDTHLLDLAQGHDMTYTRYADDLAFSGQYRGPIKQFLKDLKAVVTHEGLALREDKTCVARAGQRQEVTGLVVNEKLSIKRKTLRRFRAVLFQIERDGPQGKHWGASPDVFASLRGFASYAYMIDPRRGETMLRRVRDVEQAQRLR